MMIQQVERKEAYASQQVKVVNRLIILHAGGEDGWFEGADLVFQSKKATGDYHDEIKHQ